ECAGWPKGIADVSEGTISNFIKGKAPQRPSLIAVYLMLLSILHRHRHPALLELIPATLAEVCSPLADFDSIIGVRRIEGGANVRDVVRNGRGFYQILSTGGGRISPSSFDALFDQGLFAGLEALPEEFEFPRRGAAPASTSAELQGMDRTSSASGSPGNPAEPGASTASGPPGAAAGEDDAAANLVIHVTAIRLGHSGQAYVASDLSFRRVDVEVADRRLETFLYAQTVMRAREAHPTLRSHGFVIPRRTDAYIAQYHLDGAGLNVASISLGELGDGERAFYRGLILAVDRDNSRGALSSRIAFLRRPPSPSLLGVLSASQLSAALGNLAAPLMTYLHAHEQPGLLPIGVQASAQAQGLRTWRELDAYLKQDEVRRLLAQPENADERLTTYLTRPLMSEEG
ncbi:MAG: hypothetical protein ACK4S3_07425, partial [Parvibaculum sp.]